MKLSADEKIEKKRKKRNGSAKNRKLPRLSADNTKKLKRSGRNEKLKQRRTFLLPPSKTKIQISPSGLRTKIKGKRITIIRKRVNRRMRNLSGFPNRKK